MSALLAEMTAKALKLNVPFSVQLDLTYRCNERCVHCYLDHDDHGEMTTAEIKHCSIEMADAGVFILTLSGGEIFCARISSTILEHARRLMFCVKLKTNAVMIREKGGRPASRAGHRIDPDQYLFASAGNSRRHHSAARLAQALDRRDSISQVSRSEGHDRKRTDGAEHAGLSRVCAPGCGIGRGMHARSDRHSHDGR